MIFNVKHLVILFCQCLQVRGPSTNNADKSALRGRNVSLFRPFRSTDTPARVFTTAFSTSMTTTTTSRVMSTSSTFDVFLATTIMHPSRFHPRYQLFHFRFSFSFFLLLTVPLLAPTTKLCHHARRSTKLSLIFFLAMTRTFSM